jgi:hypothetical protein
LPNKKAIPLASPIVDIGNLPLPPWLILFVVDIVVDHRLEEVVIAAGDDDALLL